MKEPSSKCGSKNTKPYQMLIIKADMKNLISQNGMYPAIIGLLISQIWANSRKLVFLLKLWGKLANKSQPSLVPLLPIHPSKKYMKAESKHSKLDKGLILHWLKVWPLEPFSNKGLILELTGKMLKEEPSPIAMLFLWIRKLNKSTCLWAS